MDKFEPISIIEVIEREVTEPKNDGTRGSGLYNVPFRLSRTPSAEWAEYFPQAWDHPSSFSSAHRPGICRVSGDKIWLEGTTLEEVEKTHRATLLLALDETNAKAAEYEERKLAEEDNRRGQTEAHKQHVQEAAKKIKFD